MAEGPRSANTAVVLGCRVRSSGPSSALERRLETAKTLATTTPLTRVVMSGGKRWGGRSEADTMLDWWRSSKAPNVELIGEQTSNDTLENAEESAKLLRALDIDSVYLVTCDFHMKRAALLFREQGLTVIEVPAVFQRSFFECMRLRFSEWGALRLLRHKEKNR